MKYSTFPINKLCCTSSGSAKRLCDHVKNFKRGLFFEKFVNGNTGRDEENSMPLILQKNHGSESKEKRKEHLEKEEGNLKYFKDTGKSSNHRLVKEVKENLKNQKNVVIIGKPGSGKTTLAWTVCKDLHGETIGDKRCRVIVSTDSNSLPDESEITLLLLDGYFENSWIIEVTVEKIIKEIKEFCNRLSTKQIFFMWTMSKSAYSRIASFECFEILKPFEIVDLDNKSNYLSIVDMGNIFESLGMRVNNDSKSKNSESLKQKQLEKINKQFKYTDKKQVLGFPLVASLMERNRSFLGNAKFVQAPARVILESVRMLRESKHKSDNDKYITMVYAAFNSGYVDIHQVDNNLLRQIGSNHSFHDPQVNADFYLLRKKGNGCYEFIHESLLQLFFSAYGHQYLGFVIKHCPLHILLQYCVSSREKISDDEKPFYLEIGVPEHEKKISLRVMGSEFDLTHHRIWKAEGFQEMYKKVSAERKAMSKSTIPQKDTKSVKHSNGDSDRENNLSQDPMTYLQQDLQTSK